MRIRGGLVARQRSFYARVIQKLKRDAGSAWTKDVISSARLFGLYMSERVRRTSPQLVGNQLMGCLQQEAYARMLDDEGFEMRGERLPDPPAFHGLMVAWESLPTTVEIDAGLLTKTVIDGDGVACNPDLASTPLDRIRELFPACLLVDMRALRRELYGMRIDALVVYPSYDADCGYELLLVMGLDLRYGLFEPLCSKLVLRGSTLGEAIDFTVEERERLAKRCMSGIDRGMHDVIFSPLEDEEDIMLAAAGVLAVMVSDGSAIERSTHGLGTHLCVRQRPGDEVTRVSDPAKGEGAEPAPRTEPPTEDLPDGQAAPEPYTQESAVSAGEESQSPATQESEPQQIEMSEAVTPIDEQPNEGRDSRPLPSLEAEPLEEVARLERELSSERSKASSLAYHLRQAREALADAQRASAAVTERAEVLESLDLPESPMEALALAERAFPDRLVVLDSAHRSAEEFARGDAAEVWAVLRSMATVLHPMVFDRQGGNIVYAFQAQTGFELTLREMKLTKRASGTARLRTVSYHGQQHLAAAHVKGRGHARGESLRVHFFADYDERRLVIAHCGEHLTTYDTPSL